MKLNETDFVLVIPFHEQASLRLTDEETNEEYIATLSPETLAKRLFKMGLWTAIGAILVVSYYLVKKKSNNQRPPDYGSRENPYQMPR